MILGLGKLKALLILSFSSIGAGAISIPTILAGDKYTEYSFKEFNPKPEHYAMNTDNQLSIASTNDSLENQYTDDESINKFDELPTVKHSDAELIKGTKKYNNGNYVLYFGSDACPHCTDFLYSGRESPGNWIGNHKNIYKSGVFYETYSLAKTKDKLKNIKFIFFSDKIPNLDNRNNDDLATFPWTKWHETLLSQGKVQGDYVRYDKSALKARKILSLLHYYFGEKQQGIPTIIIYKDGNPFILNVDKIEELEKDQKKVDEKAKAQDSDTPYQSIVARYNLFKHLEYIFNKNVIWTND